MGSLSADTASEPKPSVERLEMSAEDSMQVSKFEFTWNDLSVTNQYISDHGWEQKPVPLVLQDLPQNAIVSEQLQNIISWSLRRFEDSPIIPGSPATSNQPVHEDQEQSHHVEEQHTSVPEPENSTQEKADGSEKSTMLGLQMSWH